MGLVTPAFSFAGFDGIIQRIEDAKNPTVSVPSSIVFSHFVSFIFGMTFNLCMLYTMNDRSPLLWPNYVLNFECDVYFFNPLIQDPNGIPFIEVFYLVFVTLVFICLYFSIITQVQSTKAVFSCLIRDNFFPRSETLNQSIYSDAEYKASAILLAIEIVLLILSLSAHLNSFVLKSITVFAFQVSYLVPIVLSLTISDKEPLKDSYCF